MHRLIRSRAVSTRLQSALILESILKGKRSQKNQIPKTAASVSPRLQGKVRRKEINNLKTVGL